VGNIQKRLLATAPTLLGLGLVAYRISPSSEPPPPKPLIFAAPPIQPGAQQAQPAEVNSIDRASGDAVTRPTPAHWDPGPALDRMLLTVPTELDAHNAPLAPDQAARAPQATPPTFTPETAQARLPLTAFPQANRPDLERLDAPPTDQPEQDTPPARRNGWWPQQQPLSGLPPMDMGGGEGPGGGSGGAGGRGAGFGGRGRGHGHRRGARR
jgi:hypothetical protein